MFRKIEDIILTNQVNLKEMRASEKCKLRSLRCCKLRAASSEFGACVAASFGARSLVAASSELGAWLLQAQSSKLACCELGACYELRARSLLAASSELATSSELTATSSEQQALELGACLLRARSLLQQAPELGALWSSASSGARQAPELSGAWSLLHERNVSFGEAPKLRSLRCNKLRSSPELGACCSKLHGTKKKKKAMSSPSSSSSFLATQRRSNTKRNAYLGPAWVQLQSLQAPSSFQIPSSLPLQANSKLQARSRSTSVEPGALAME